MEKIIKHFNKTLNAYKTLQLSIQRRSLEDSLNLPCNIIQLENNHGLN